MAEPTDNDPSNGKRKATQEDPNSPNKRPKPEGWRVKLYRLNIDGSWDDCGTGRIQCLPAETPQPSSLCVTAESDPNRVLLRTRVLLNNAYQRQGENIITWCEPFYQQQQQRGPNNNSNELQRQEVDLALSFQDNEGCLDIWNQIAHVRQSTVEDVAARAAAQHHADLQKWDMPPQEPLVLPDPPSLENLEQIADTVAMVQQQRDALAMAVGDEDCRYLRLLLALFPAAEELQDYGKLATLAACIKTILLVNDVTILETVVRDAVMFEKVCASLEYDPDLREKANHRWFLQTRAKFRTVVPMYETGLIDAIHRSFRIQYLKDTMLRPTMDESALSTLSSLQQFTHSEVIKGITSGQCDHLRDSYLVKVVRLLGIEVYTLQQKEWSSTNDPEQHSEMDLLLLQKAGSAPSTPRSTDPDYVPWKQHVAPQDMTLPARRERRKGCLSFLRELFTMARTSLQQGDKDDFFNVVSTVAVEFVDSEVDNNKPTVAAKDTTVPSSANVLSLLSNLLLDHVDDGEKNMILEILAAIAMHDPGLLRRHCLSLGPHLDRPQPNEKSQTLFLVPPRDTVSSLLFLLATETDAGVLLQITELLRIILDTDVVGDATATTTAMFNPDDRLAQAASIENATEQRKFLTLFYEHYIEWLVIPFAGSILRPRKRVPQQVWTTPDTMLERLRSNFEKAADDPLLRAVTPNAIRLSFAVDALGYCVRTHVHQARAFLLRSKTLVNVSKLLESKPHVLSGDRCLKLAVLRLLRSILAVNDEYYHRHIIQHDLFAYVFQAFRANPVGDNLVSSAVMEICAYIVKEEIRSMVEYIVTKHMGRTDANQSLEDFSKPYVSTLNDVRVMYDAMLQNPNVSTKNDVRVMYDAMLQNPMNAQEPAPSGTQPPEKFQTQKALEDQRKFHQADEEESYFMDDAEPPGATAQHPTVDSELGAQEKELHRTPRMFSLPLINSLEDRTLSLGQTISSLHDQDPNTRPLSPMEGDDPPTTGGDHGLREVTSVTISQSSPDNDGEATPSQQPSIPPSDT